MAGKTGKNKGLGYDLFREISKEKLLKLPKKDLIDIILSQNDIQIPVSVFLNKTAPLESLVIYLKDEKKLDIKTIAKRLNRNIQTIWTTYANAKNKPFEYTDSGCKIPLNIFSKTDKSVLESLVFYMKDSLRLRFCEISKILNRDSREIYCYYHRYTAKIKKEHQKTK